MSGSLGNLLIKLQADTGEATGDIGKAAHQIERDMQAMATKATAAGAAIGIVIAEIGMKMAGAARDALMLGDALSKMSQRTGVSVSRLSEIAYAGDLADVSLGQLGQGMSQFSKALVDAEKDGSRAQRMFEALGVSINEGPQVAFEQMAKAINSLPDGETKVAAMRAAFGRSGDAMIPLISGLEDATDKARKLGITMSEEMAHSSERFNDSMTTLGAATSALIRNALSPTVSVLAEISSNLVTAAAKGQFLTGVLMELGRVGAATLGGIAALFGDEKAVDEAARAFAQMGPQTEPSTSGGGAKPTVDQDKLRAALARIGGGKDKKSKDDNLYGKQLQEDMDEQAKIMAEAAAATDKYNQTVRDRAQAEVDAEIAAQVARAESIVQMQELIDQQTRMANGWDENGKKIVENTKKASDWARELGLTFTSAFEDAVVSGKKLSEVVRSLAQDIAKMFLRKQVTEPLGNWFSKASSQFFDGLFKADGGPVSAGSPYIVGERGPELFVPAASGSIVPNHAMAGMGGVTIVQNNHFALGLDAVVRDGINRELPRIAQAAVSAVRADRNRTGDAR